MSRQALRQPFAYGSKVRQSSAKHQQIRINDSQNITQTDRQQVKIAFDVLTRPRIALLPERHDVG